MDTTEAAVAVEQAAGMPWYAWVVIALIVAGVGYRTYQSRKQKTGGGPGRPGGPGTPPRHDP